MKTGGGELEGSRTRDLLVSPERSPDVAVVDFHGADFHDVVLERAFGDLAFHLVEIDLVEAESAVQRRAAVEQPVAGGTRVAEEPRREGGSHDGPQKRSGKLRSDLRL